MTVTRAYILPLPTFLTSLPLKFVKIAIVNEISTGCTLNQIWCLNERPFISFRCVYFSIQLLFQATISYNFFQVLLVKLNARTVVPTLRYDFITFLLLLLLNFHFLFALLPFPSFFTYWFSSSYFSLPFLSPSLFPSLISFPNSLISSPQVEGGEGRERLAY